MTKIVHITESFAATGGIETYILELLPQLEAQGFQNVIIYRQPEPTELPEKRYPAYWVPQANGRFAERNQVRQILAQEQPDLIYLHDVYNPEVAAEAVIHAPAIAYVHNFYQVCPGLGKYFRRGDTLCQRAFGLGCVANIYARRCASAKHPRSVYRIMAETRQHLSIYRQLPKTLVASSYMKALLVQNGFDPQRVEVLPYFIPLPDVVELTQTKLPTMLFAGRLEREKGFPYLLQAMQQMKTNGRLLVAGEGTYREAYETMATDVGLAKQVEFLGWLDDAELHAAYQESNLFVMPSIWPEPFGKVGIEAMARGRPAVAFAVGGIPDWLQNGRNGYAVPVKDVKRLASSLDQLLSNPELAIQMGQRGRQDVVARYAYEAHMTRLLSLLRQTANSAAPIYAA